VNERPTAQRLRRWRWRWPWPDSPVWVQRGCAEATLDQIAGCGVPDRSCESLEPELAVALNQAIASGGMRPKAFISGNGRSFIAKLSSRSDQRPVTNLEAVAMDLAGRAGINVARSELARAANRDVLLVERFDRTPDGARLMIVSAATMLGLDPYHGARYATYPELADRLRATSVDAGDACELFARIAFNIIIGNTDDHARNHAAIWDGLQLKLAPAFDIYPQPRSGGETQQAMDIGRDGFKAANLAGCVKRAFDYGLDQIEAFELIEHQIEIVTSQWSDAADQARLNAAERQAAFGGPILNPSIFYDWDDQRPRSNLRGS
jgi:serine/threonine-protein kinase HipA